jgi:hypothetical protein
MSRTWNYDCSRAPRGIKLMMLTTDGEIKYGILNSTNAAQMKAWAVAGESSIEPRKDSNEALLARIEARLARIESRNVQMMFHLGLDAHERLYDRPNQHATHPSQPAQSSDASSDE